MTLTSGQNALGGYIRDVQGISYVGTFSDPNATTVSVHTGLHTGGLLELSQLFKYPRSYSVTLKQHIINAIGKMTKDTKKQHVH